MITFKNILPDILNVSTGELIRRNGIPETPQKPPEAATISPSPEVEGEKSDILDLFRGGTPLNRVLQGIDELGVADKESLKTFARDTYAEQKREITPPAEKPKEIVGKSENDNFFDNTTFVNKMDNYVASINPDIEKRGEKLVAPQKWYKTLWPKLKENISNKLNKIPVIEEYVETPIEKNLKKEVFDEYPFTKDAQIALTREKISDESPKVEPTLGLVKGKKYYLGVTEYPKNPLEQFLFGRIKNIGVSDWSTETSAHEFFHVLLTRRGLPRPWREFDKSWEQSKKDFPLLESIDEHINNAPLYTDINQDNMTSERFAYLGGIVGRKGLDGIPPELKIYYEGYLNRQQSNLEKER